ncbi:MAG TPA: HTTM domain-containing protein [Polyangia bacterium]|nr:HTTM domain-containing protein [Polyangia bacterium]
MTTRFYERVRDVYLTADNRSLAAGRIMLALVLLRDLIARWTEMGIWYTNDGIIPNHTLLWRPSWDHVFSLFYLASYGYEAAIGFVICLIAYLALLVGFRTKLAQVATAICLISLHGRTLLFDNGGDVVLGLLTIWTTFLPTGRVWSVDAVFARRRAAAEAPPDPSYPSYPSSPSSGSLPAAGPEPKTFVSLGVWAVLAQLAIIYFFNAIHKGGTTWRSGSAVHYAIHLDRLATWFGVWLRHHMSPTVAKGLTYSALATEGVLPVLLLSPYGVRHCRRIAIVLVIGLHMGFAACLNLGNFVPAMIAYTPNFIRGEDWDALERWWARSGKRVALGTRVRARLSSWILRLAALLTPGRWTRVAGPGPAFAAIRRRLPAAREVTIVVLMGIAASQVLDENWGAHKVIDHHNPKPVAAAVSYLGLFQGWSMFAPEAPMTDFNMMVDAVTVDGRHVDPYNEIANPRYPHPGFTIPPRLGPSWIFYGYGNHIRGRGAYHQALLEWVLRYPERTGRPKDKIVSFVLWVVEDDSPPLGEQTPRNVRWNAMIRYPQ